jgi:alpha-D-xyloside xylohydrolase
MPARRALAALLIALSVVPAAAQQAIVVSTPRLSLAISPDSGSLRLTIVARDTMLARGARFPGLTVDGALQRGYRVVSDGTSPVLRTGAVRLAIERLNNRAIAATWTVPNGVARELELQLASDDEARDYGTGERFNALNQRGYVLPLVTDDRYGNKGVGTHKPIPFFLSTQGFGVWLDSWMPAVFDLSGTDRNLTRVRVTDTTLRVVLIAGPALADILDGFTELTGRPRVPPPWAFGLWKSRDVHHNRDSVLADIERLRSHGIPASVLVLDSPWETGYNDFVVNRRQFSEPEEMFARIGELGFRLCLWLTPMVNVRNVIDMRGIDSVSSNWDEAVRRRALVAERGGTVALSEWWKGLGGLVDFTDPAASAWWHGELSKTKAYRAFGFKADDGEGNFVPQAVFHDGTNPRAMKNRYAILYNEALQRYIDRELGGDGVLITRTGYTGTQRFPFAWAGDNRADFSFADGLPSVILAGQNAALSGIPMWGSDIAGYAGRPTKEVFIRWTQFGAFSPFMQVHMTSNLGPWDFDRETLEIFREFTRLRTQLFPYLYAAAEEASRTGLPIIRPMVLAFPDDADARDHVFQYLFGPDLLVAPITSPGRRVPCTSRPAAGWITGAAAASLDHG